MPRLFHIFIQSDYLIQIADINWHTEWQTVQIQISWLLRSQLIWIYIVCKGRVSPGSAGQGFSLGKFCKWQIYDILLNFPRRMGLTFHADCLSRRPFAWAAKPYFLGKNNKYISKCCPLKFTPRMLISGKKKYITTCIFFSIFYRNYYYIILQQKHNSRVERKTMVTQTYFWNPCLGATWTPL